jgi:hypothetical protein
MRKNRSRKPKAADFKAGAAYTVCEGCISDARDKVISRWSTCMYCQRTFCQDCVRISRTLHPVPKDVARCECCMEKAFKLVEMFGKTRAVMFGNKVEVKEPVETKTEEVTTNTKEVTTMVELFQASPEDPLTARVRTTQQVKGEEEEVKTPTKETTGTLPTPPSAPLKKRVYPGILGTKKKSRLAKRYANKELTEDPIVGDSQ